MGNPLTITLTLESAPSITLILHGNPLITLILGGAPSNTLILHGKNSDSHHDLEKQSLADQGGTLYSLGTLSGYCLDPGARQ
jgi:hypothetical protein